MEERIKLEGIVTKIYKEDFEKGQYTKVIEVSLFDEKRPKNDFGINPLTAPKLIISYGVGEEGEFTFMRIPKRKNPMSINVSPEMNKYLDTLEESSSFYARVVFSSSKKEC